MNKKFNVGIDLVHISRFTNMPYEKNKKFYNKIFKKAEINYCIKFKNPYPHFAGRFAAKEAIKKTIKKKISMLDIEINQRSGKPFVKIDKSFPYSFSISISHDGDYAIAIAIIE